MFKIRIFRRCNLSSHFIIRDQYISSSTAQIQYKYNFRVVSCERHWVWSKCLAMCMHIPPIQLFTFRTKNNLTCLYRRKRQRWPGLNWGSTWHLYAYTNPLGLIDKYYLKTKSKLPHYYFEKTISKRSTVPCWYIQRVSLFVNSSTLSRKLWDLDSLFIILVWILIIPLPIPILLLLQYASWRSWVHYFSTESPDPIKTKKLWLRLL